MPQGQSGWDFSKLLSGLAKILGIVVLLGAIVAVLFFGTTHGYQKYQEWQESRSAQEQKLHNFEMTAHKAEEAFARTEQSLRRISDIQSRAATALEAWNKANAALTVARTQSPPPSNLTELEEAVRAAELQYNSVSSPSDQSFLSLKEAIMQTADSASQFHRYLTFNEELRKKVDEARALAGRPRRTSILSAWEDRTPLNTRPTDEANARGFKPGALFAMIKAAESGAKTPIEANAAVCFLMLSEAYEVAEKWEQDPMNLVQELPNPLVKIKEYLLIARSRCDMLLVELQAELERLSPPQ